MDGYQKFIAAYQGRLIYAPIIGLPAETSQRTNAVLFGPGVITK